MSEDKELVLGIDDAGRGPVIGPMVLAGCVMTRKTESELKELGVKDSKVLTHHVREHLVELIKKHAKSFCVEIIDPADIDSGMGKKLNLNQVEAFAAAAIINKLAEKLSNQEKKTLGIIIDCPSNNKLSWMNYLSELLVEKNLHVRCEHKADRDYPVVSAASIIAKTTRDHEIAKLKKQIGIDFGSGYTSDPKTQAFLKKHSDGFKKERIFRESWVTWKNHNHADKKSKQAKLFE